MGIFERATATMPSPTTVIAFLALFLAMGGGGYLALAKPSKKTAAKLYRADRFLPEASEVEYRNIGLGSRTCTSSPFIEGTGFFNASVDLPDGAMIKKVTFYYVDNDTDDNLGFGLSSHFIDEGGGLHLNDEFAVGASSSGASPENRTAEVTLPTPYEVDNGAEDVVLGTGFEECSLQATQEGEEVLILHGALVEYELK